MPGVVVPLGQFEDDSSRGTPLTVSHAYLALMVPAQWFDKDGKGHTEMLFIMGDKVYRDPNGEDWARRLQQLTDDMAGKILPTVKSQLKKLIKEVLEEEKSSILQDASVDVMGDEAAEAAL